MRFVKLLYALRKAVCQARVVIKSPVSFYDGACDLHYGGQSSNPKM